MPRPRGVAKSRSAIRGEADRATMVVADTRRLPLDRGNFMRPKQAKKAGMSCNSNTGAMPREPL